MPATAKWSQTWADKPIHSEILTDTHRFKGLVAGRRGGKTTILRGRSAYRASRARSGQVVWYVAPTLKQARANFYVPFKAELKRAGIRFEKNDSRLEITFPRGGQVVCQSTTESKFLRGSGLLEVYLDEAQDMPWETWESIIRPMLADYQAPCWLAGTVNGAGTLWHTLWRQGREGDELYDPDWKSWIWTAYEAGTVARSEIESARLSAERRGPTAMKQFRREWMADWTAFAGQVFEEWAPERMVVDKLPAGVRIMRSVLGVDWGFSSEHYGVMQVWGCDQRGRWWLLEEVAQPSQTWTYWLERAHYLHAKWRFETAWAPDDQPGGVAELRKGSWYTRPVDRTKRKQRIMALAELMHTGRFFIVGRGTKLESEIPGYQWDRMTDGTLKDEPKKGKDDGIDCAAHALHSETLVPRMSMR